MKWSTEQPREPGYYWIAESGEKPQLVEVNVVSDSHNMMYVLLPGDENWYPLGMWHGALWVGPLPLPE